MAKDDDLKDQQTDDDEEQSEDQDQADVDESGVDEGDDDGTEEEGEDDADDDSDDKDDESEEELIDDEKFNALKDDPIALRKELNRAATKKFQDLSAARKAVKPYADFITAFEQDPRTATKALARQLGIEIKEPKTEKQAEDVVEDIATAVKKRVSKALGPEYADLADKLSDAIRESAELIVEDKVKPLKSGQDSLISDAAATKAAQVIERFDKKYPDWKKVEGEMTKLSKKMVIGEGMDEFEYMESLYLLATADGKVGDRVRKTVKKMVDNVARSEGRSRTVSDKTVSRTPGKLPTFKESAAAAIRGERFED